MRVHLQLVSDSWKSWSAFACPWQSAKLRRINGDFSPQFASRLALKDVRLALSALADEWWQQPVSAGLGDQDLTVVTQTLERRAGAR